MIFSDGIRKAGHFENNVYKQPLETIQEFEEDEEMDKFPPDFKAEL